jgi:hypothetical protein
MNSLGKMIVTASLGCLTGQMFGCASSDLVNIWRDPSFQAPPLGKVLVIAMRKDATRRRIWEDAFSGELAKHGIMATSSYGLFPEGPPDTNQVAATAQADGFDGVIVVLRLQTETSPHYVKGYASMEPEGAEDNGPYWQRYWNTYLLIKHSGHIDSQKVAFRTIEVMTTGNNGRLIWSATSKTADPDSVKDLQTGIATLVVSELVHHIIIKAMK